MNIEDILGYFELETEERRDELLHALENIRDLPHSFITLNWHESHDFLWISSDVEQISGHPIENFQKLGIPFILSITPKSLIPAVSETLDLWRQLLDSDPGKILETVIMEVPGALLGMDGKRTDLVCHSLILDYTPGKITSYLILTISFARDKIIKNMDQAVRRANELQQKIHELYMLMKPGRFGMVRTYLSLTIREKEIAGLIRDGQNSREIADGLSISEGTVTSHRKNILRKLGVKNTAEMVNLLNQVTG